MKFASSFLAVALAVGRLVAATPAVNVAKDAAISAEYCGDTCSDYPVNPGVCTATEQQDIENVVITPSTAQCQIFVGSQCQGNHIPVQGAVSIPSEYSTISSITCTLPA
ncbi:hypothetical protein PILCRDRAFT_826073 [Piloderma croceum F 1598]|uniref:Hydrophobin n=1 Tax=Piloderma croceum (strain F 1598) TaxID=765440 RepID=A0A0C3F9W7_PILCF|nr:hypothetical protein PILCRDRAFT_826073 [Piloderma croceum F 1598]